MLTSLAKALGFVPAAASSYQQARADDLAARLVVSEQRLWRLVESRLIAAKEIRAPLSAPEADQTRRTSGMGNIAMTEWPTDIPRATGP